MAEAVYPRVSQGSAPVELEVELAGVTLRGVSVAARATAFAVPELGATLDIGRMSPSLAAQPVVLLSHGHLDHLSGVLAYLNVRARFHPETAPLLAAPREVAEPLRQALAVMPGMESVRKRVRLADVIRGVTAGEAVELPGGRAVAFAVDHSVPTLGWRLLRGRERRPLLVYAADSTIDPFRADPALLDARAAVVECTFAGRNRRIAARLARHAHLSDWVELAPRLTCDTLVLAHLPELPAAELAALAEPLAEVFGGRLVLWAEPPGGERANT